MVGMMGKFPPDKPLTYSIHKWSSYSANYHPCNILIDNPTDHMSRWQSGSNFPPQFITVKLAKPAILRTITFGKFQKTHVCNLQRFKVFGGMTDERMVELCEKGLKNDSKPENFELQHKFNGSFLPSQYIKIVPVATWGTSFNFSIWYITLSGIDDQNFVQPCVNHFTLAREEKAIRLCLKHFRQHNYSEAFESLQKRTKVQLEHPILTSLHEKLVISGDFDSVEKKLEEAFREGLLDEYISRQEYTAKWEQVNTPSIIHYHSPHNMVCDVDILIRFLYILSIYYKKCDLFKPDCW